MRPRQPGDVAEPARPSNQPEQAQLQRKAGINRLGGRRLASLVVDDPQPSVP